MDSARGEDMPHGQRRSQHLVMPAERCVEILDEDPSAGRERVDHA
jgi:hypothetical protein